MQAPKKTRHHNLLVSKRSNGQIKGLLLYKKEEPTVKVSSWTIPDEESSDDPLANEHYLNLKLLKEMSDKLDYEYVMGMNCTHAEILIS